MNAANSSVSLKDQFQALQDLQQRGDAAAALATAEQLLQRPLNGDQRALVLQLQGELQRGQGDQAQALALWGESLALRFSPRTALLALELVLLPAIDWPQRPQWLAWMRQLLRQGHGASLLRWLAQVLEQYPLIQQRQELLSALAQDPVISRALEREFNGLWQRLQARVGPR